MTRAPPAGEEASQAPGLSSGHGPDGSVPASPPSDDELLRHLGAAVLLCWGELSFASQVKILAQTNEVIGTRPIAGARNEIVKLLLRHTKI